MYHVQTGLRIAAHVCHIWILVQAVDAARCCRLIILQEVLLSSSECVLESRWIFQHWPRALIIVLPPNTAWTLGGPLKFIVEILCVSPALVQFIWNA